MAGPNESAISIVVPEADDVITPWRDRHDPVARQGVPGHITLLYPFVPADELCEGVLAPLRDVLATIPPFTYALTAIDEFPGVLWLRPEDRGELLRLTGAIRDVYPQYPAYGGAFPDIRPHVTIGHATTDAQQRTLREAIGLDVAPYLPIACRADAVTVLRSDADGMWSQHQTLLLGA